MVGDELGSFQHFGSYRVDLQTVLECRAPDQTVIVPLLSQVKALRLDEESALFEAPFLDFLVPIPASGYPWTLAGNLIVNFLLVVVLFVSGDQFVVQSEVQLD